MEAWRPMFLALKKYADQKKKSRKNWRRATIFYYRMLFKKFAKSIQIEKTGELKSFYFTLWLRNHLTCHEREIRIRELDRVILKKKMLKKWRASLSLLNKVQKFAFVFNEISRRVYLSRALKQLIKEYLRNFTMERYTEIQSVKLMKKAFDGWREHMQLDLIKRLKVGRAYEFHYFKILKTMFNTWKTGIKLHQQHKDKITVQRKFFDIWKDVYLFIDSKKNKLSTLYHSLILLRVYFRSFKERIWLQKRNKVAKQFYKCQLFMAWKIVMAKLIHKNIQKKKAWNYFKIIAKRKYFHKLWTNMNWERRLNKDNNQKLAFYTARSGKALRKKYFYILKNFIILNKVSKNRDLHIQYKYFQKLLQFSTQASILKKRRKELSKLRVTRKKYNLFGVLKQAWLVLKRKELIAHQFFSAKLIRISFIELLKNRQESLAQKFRMASDHYKMAIYHKIFYNIHFHRLKQKQARRVSSNIDWFIEKKIIKLFSGIFRFWKSWAIANQKFKLRNRDLVYRCFYSLKLNCKLKEINL